MFNNMKSGTTRVAAITGLLMLAALAAGLFAPRSLGAPHATPTIDGTITAGEYGNHTDGQNAKTSGTQTWYMTWDETNLYVAVQNANITEGAVLYIDADPLIPPRGGTDANGNLTGQEYDNTNFAQLPFRADFVTYFKTDYREYRTDNGAGGWSGATTGFGTYDDEGTTNTRELAIPWSAITGAGRPASFNFFGYVGYNNQGGSGVYAQVPPSNPGGTITTAAVYDKYYEVTSTDSQTGTPPFSQERDATVEATATSTVTETATQTATEIASETATQMASSTATVSGEETKEPESTATSTVPVLPSNTASATPSQTSTGTSTTIPSSTSTATLTTTSTSAPSSTATSTTVPSSTSTATRTATTVPSSTVTTAATSTRTNTAVATGTNTAVAGTSTAVPSATVTACPIQFADVPPDHTFYTFIRCLACRGIVSGYPCGGPGEECNANDDPYYRPGANVTRGQLSKIIANSAGLDDPIAEGQQQFADVPPGSPFYEFVERLAQTGAIAGYPCGGPGVTEPCDSEGRPYFRPNNPATRGQISKIVSIAAGFEEDVPSDQQTFTDVDQDSPFWVYIERLAGRGIISGYGDESRCPETGAPCFRYNENTTRGQMAKIAANAFFPNCSTPARP